MKDRLGVIYLDMDGVLTDFAQAACAAHGVNLAHLYPAGQQRTYKMNELLGITDDEFWEPLNTLGFWSGLELTEWAEDLFEVACDLVGRKNVYFLTSPSRSPHSIAGKHLWIKKHFSRVYHNRQIILTSKKYCCSAPDALLIDDLEKNAVRFIERGGKFMAWPQPWNSAHAEADWAKSDPAGYVKGFVEREFR